MNLSPTVEHDVSARYPAYLHDESRMRGEASGLILARGEQDVVDVLARAMAEGVGVTLQGARTGIAGGSTPQGGWVLSLTRMDRIRGMGRTAAGAYTMTVEPGLTLADLHEALADPKGWDVSGWTEPARELHHEFCRAGRHFFPPDLTETGASIGGLVASNGSGARTYRYGAARESIAGLRVVLADGQVVSLARGRDRACGLTVALPLPDGTTLGFELPDYTMPGVKSAAGYYACPDMDLVDLFVGSEGTLGVVVAAELVLQPVPAVMWGATCFLPAEREALQFVRAVRERGSRAAAIEYFDARALTLLRRLRHQQQRGGEIPDIPDAWGCAVYVEYHANDEQEAEATQKRLSELLSESGGDPAATWFAGHEADVDRFKGLRHAVPEAVNMQIDIRRRREPGLTKLGTDLAVPDASLERVMAMYHEDLDALGLDYVIFGHIGNNHVHVNVLPRTQAEYDAGKALYLNWCKRVVAWGGSVAGEHGIGKLKCAMLELMFGDTGIAAMRRVKCALDPAWRLGRGTLFSMEATCSDDE